MDVELREIMDALFCIELDVMKLQNRLRKLSIKCCHEENGAGKQRFGDSLEALPQEFKPTLKKNPESQQTAAETACARKGL